jgi:hypothetical protein
MLDKLEQHAVACPDCNGKIISQSLFEKMMAWKHLPTEAPTVKAFLHAVEAAYGFKPRLQGFQTASGVIVPDPFINEQQAQVFYTMFRTHIAGAHALIGWADFLPCSLETPEFMEEHHKAFFRVYGGEAQAECVELYNRIGKRQRDTLEAQRFDRPWTFWHLMLRKDLAAIANGRREFEHIREGVRRRCLEDVFSKIADARWKVNLVVAERLPKAAAWFDTCDNVVCIDSRFSFRRNRVRVIVYSTDNATVEASRKALDAFVAQARYSEKGESERLLRQLIAGMRRG